MKTLSTSFSKLGFSHTQIERTGNVAIFERKKPHRTRSHFEVVLRINCPGDVVATFPT